MPDSTLDQIIRAARRALGMEKEEPQDFFVPAPKAAGFPEHGVPVNPYTGYPNPNDGPDEVRHGNVVQDDPEPPKAYQTIGDQHPTYERMERENRQPKTTSNDELIKRALENIQKQEKERQRVEELRKRLTSGN